ncbi:MAG: hypothetical protein J1D77_07220 [Muribaculaceae bacterium]|nr:hypothetical protein [Muribaculaceae bacterium]
MKTPVFKYSKLCYAVSAVLTIPLLIDICTACRLFSLWIAWLLLILIGAISMVRLWFGFRQHLYKFSWGLIGQLLLGAGVLIFFQLSINRVIETPVSNPVAPAVVDITDPFKGLDSTHNKGGSDGKHISHPAKKEEKTTDKKVNHKKK